MKIAKLSLKSLRLVFKSSPTASILTCICYAVNGLFPAAITWFLSRIVDDLIVAGVNGLDFSNLIFLIVCFIINYAAQFIISITMNVGIFEKCNSKCRLDIAGKSARLPLIFYEKTEILESMTKAKDCVDQEIFGMYFMLIIKGIGYAITFWSVLILLSSYSVWLMLVSLISVIPYLFVRLIRGKAMYNLRRKQIPEERKTSYFWSLFTNSSTAKDIRLLNADNYFFKRWETLRIKTNEAIRRESKKETKHIAFCEFITVLGYIISLTLSLWMVLNGILSVGIFSACIFAFSSMQNATKALFESIGYGSTYLYYIKDYFIFMELPENTRGMIVPGELKDKITFKNVLFKYPNTENYAVDVNDLTIYKGETIAVVGENGSGKTTLTKLICGQYSAESGKIYWDENEIEKLDLSVLNQHIGIVAQKPTKFKLPLNKTVAFSNSVDDKKITEILKKLEIRRFESDEISTETMLGKEFNGTDLSEGEWQKIALARCVYKNAAFLILDEPTSSLDPIIELSILKNFIKMSENKTSVIISHRIGICAFVDRVVVLKNGKVVQNGAHRDLILTDGEYRNMYNAQKQWYE